MKQLGIFGAVERAEFKALVGKCRKILAETGLDEEQQLNLLADLMLDEIRNLIGKFPQEQQKQIVARLADGFLCEWNNGKQCNEN